MIAGLTVAAIHGERVRQVRRIRRLTQSDLADLVGVKQGAISQVEAGIIQPSPQLLSSISRATGFADAFFARSPGPGLPLGSLVFRARRAAVKTKKDIEEAHSWAELIYECATYLATKVEPIAVRVPIIPGEAPGRTAQIARSSLGLPPDRPISNLTMTLESYGVLILALPVPLAGRDAFSAWVGHEPVPIVVLSSGIPGDRVRFSLSHELCHLIAHPAYRGYVKEVEASANEFAGEFLLPGDGIRNELVLPVSLASLAPLKARWGVSLQALLMRARELGLVSHSRASQLFRRLSSTGARRREPASLDIPIEKPRALRKMAEIVYGYPIDPRKLATDLDLPPQLAAAIMGAHADRSELRHTTIDDGRPGHQNVIEFPTADKA